MDRARLTITDLILFFASFAFLAIMWPLMAEVMDKSGGALNTGEQFVWLLVLPLGIVVMFLAIYRTAIAGVGR